MKVTSEGARALTGSMLILTLAACGGGASVSPAAPQGVGDTQAYCTAKKAFETAPAPVADFQSGSPQELAAAGREYAATTLRPIMNDILAAAPVEAPLEVLDAYKVLDNGITQFEVSGDFFLFNAPEFGTAQTTTHVFDRANCDWTRVDVTATDFTFAGVPETLQAGTTVTFDLTNQSNGEIHEMAIFKKSDATTEPIQALLESTDEATRQMATLVTTVLAAPGKSAYKVAEFVPGTYAMVCTVHVGATPEKPQGDGPAHYAEGMVTEFTVT